MPTINFIRQVVLYGIYYFTAHALEELDADGLDEFDAETALLYGKIRKSWPRESKYEVIGPSNDGRKVGVICRITQSNKLRIITAYEDKKRS